MKKHLSRILAFCLSLILALPVFAWLQAPGAFAADFVSTANIAQTTDKIKDTNTGSTSKWRSVDFGSLRKFTRIVITFTSANSIAQFRIDKFNFETRDYDNFYPATPLTGTGATRTVTVELDEPVEASKIRVFLPQNSTGGNVSTVAVYNDSPIATVTNFDIITSVSVPPVLPNYFNIDQENGGRVLLPITWPALAAQGRDRCMTAGTYTVSGTYSDGGISGAITANITVNAESNLTPMPVPYMGWNHWYYCYSGINQRIAQAQALALQGLGLDKLGYDLMWIDDFWWGKGSYSATEDMYFRDENGNTMTRENFNYDFGQWIDWLHNRGLRAGIYTDTGPRGCGEIFGSGGANWFEFFRNDVAQFVEWGADAVKLDHCGGHNDSVNFSGSGYDGLSRNEYVYSAFYQAMQEKDPEHTMMLNICEWGQEGPPEWGYKIANTWRTQGDLGGELVSGSGNNWNRFLAYFDDNLAPAANRPNTVNDPDYVIFGPDVNGNTESRLTDHQTRTYFTLWCMTAAPLILSCDLTEINDYNFETISNRDMISIDQDPLVKQYSIIREDIPGLQVCAKPLVCETPGRAKYAVMLFNRTDYDGEIGFNWSDIGLGNVVSAKNVWAYKDEAISGNKYSADVEAYGVVVLIVEGDKVPVTCGRPSNNLALGLGVEALGNSATNCHYNAQKAVDSYIGTGWQPVNTDPRGAFWIQLDLGVVKTFDQIVLRLSGTPGAASRLEKFDGTAWVSIRDIASNGLTATANVLDLGAYHSAQLIRWYIPSGSARPTLTEFEVYDSANKTNDAYENMAKSSGIAAIYENLALKAIATAQSLYPGYPAPLVNDGNNGTRWNSVAGAMNGGNTVWLKLSYDEPTASNGMEVYFGDWYQRHARARIEYSYDDSTWYPIGVMALNPTDGQFRVEPTTVISYPTVEARYYRIVFEQGINYSGGTDPTLWEWRMFDYPLTEVADTFVITKLADAAGALPGTVNATRADGKTMATAVVWDSYPLAVGDYEVEGSVTGSDIKAKARLIIIADDDSKYVLSFDLTPADALVSLFDGLSAPVAELINGYYYLPPGTYAYTVSKAGYLDKSGTVTITNSAVTTPVSLEMARYDVSFSLNIPDARVVVQNSANATVAPESGGGYRLTIGTYKYTVTRLGYTTITETVEITGNAVIPVVLIKKDNLALFATATATSSYNSGYAAGMANDDDLGTRWNTRVRAAEEDAENWLQLEWAEPTESNTVIIYYHDFIRIGYAALQYWDGADWIDLVYMSDNADADDIDEVFVLPTTRLVYPNITTTKLRISFYEARFYDSGTDYTVREFQVYNYPIVNAFPASMTAQTYVNVAPELPKTVMAVRSNGLEAKTPVIWDKIDPSGYAQAGTFTVGGTVFASDVRVSATITVKPLEPGMEAIAFYDSDGNDITKGGALPETGDLTVKVVINNDEPVHLFAAAYDGKKIVDVGSATVAKNDQSTAVFTLNLPADRTGVLVKVFRWDIDYVPLVDPLIFPAQ